MAIHFHYSHKVQYFDIPNQELFMKSQIIKLIVR